MSPKSRSLKTDTLIDYLNNIEDKVSLSCLILFCLGCLDEEMQLGCLKTYSQKHCYEKTI